MFFPFCPLLSGSLLEPKGLYPTLCYLTGTYPVSQPSSQGGIYHLSLLGPNTIGNKTHKIMKDQGLKNVRDLKKILLFEQVQDQ